MNRVSSVVLHRLRMLVRCGWDLARGRRIYWELTDRGWEYIGS